MADIRRDRRVLAVVAAIVCTACGTDDPTIPVEVPAPPLVVDVSAGLVTTDADSFLAALRALDTDTVKIEQVLIILRQQVNPLSPGQLRELGPAVLLLPVEAGHGNTRGGIETGTSSYWDPAIQDALSAVVQNHGGQLAYVYETLPALKATLPADSASRRDLFADLSRHPNLDWVEPAGPGYFDPPSNPVPLGGVRVTLDEGDPIGNIYPPDATIRYALSFDTRDTVFASVCDLGEQSGHSGHWTVFLERLEGVWVDVGWYGCAFGFPLELVLPPGSQWRDSVSLWTAPPPSGKYRFYWGYRYEAGESVAHDSALSIPFQLQ